MSHIVKALASALACLVLLLVPLAASAAVNLNTASVDELVAVPGIGPKKAQQIVESRETQGPFKSVDDLKRIKGFRDKLVDNLRPHLAVAPPPAKAASGKGAAPKDAKPAANAARADAGRVETAQRK
jgi:competence protein ComEA